MQIFDCTMESHVDCREENGANTREDEKSQTRSFGARPPFVLALQVLEAINRKAELSDG